MDVDKQIVDKLNDGKTEFLLIVTLYFRITITATLQVAYLAASPCFVSARGLCCLHTFRPTSKMTTFRQARVRETWEWCLINT